MLTETQKLQRIGKLGSSAAAAALGLDPYRSPADVYLELTGQADGFEGNEATERGNLLEPVLVQWASQKLGKRVNPDQMFTHSSGMLCWNADALISADELPGGVWEGIEAKTTVDGSEWGAEETDEIPERHLVQIAHAFAVAPALKVMWVPVLIAGFKCFDFRMYRVDRNDELASLVESKGLEFMRQHVIPKVPPTDFKPSLEVLKRVRREPNKTVTISGELLDKYISFNAAKKQACDDAEVVQAELIASLHDAEAGTTEDGRRITYMTQKRAGYTVKDTEFRVLRVAKKK